MFSGSSKYFPTKRGFSYPLSIEDGGLRLSTDYDLVKEAIFSVIETRLLERIMRPNLGMPEYIFTAVYDKTIIAEQIRQALQTQVAEVEDWDISGKANDTGVFELTINYVINRIPQPAIKYQLIL